MTLATWAAVHWLMFAGGGGSWTASGPFPHQYQKDFRYAGPELRPTGVGRGQKITPYVAWSWKLPVVVPGQVVLLCVDQGRNCQDVSGNPKGTTTAFAGQSANQVFQFFLLVKGSGMLQPPVVGGEGQVIVNYQ